MSKLFRRKLKPCNLRSQKLLYGTSTPKKKVDVAVECDLPFDESKIAPELRRKPRAGVENCSGKSPARQENADRVNKTNLELVDISVEPSHEEETSSSDVATEFQRAHCSREKVRVGLEVQDISDPDDFCNGKNSEKGKQKEKVEENIKENNHSAGGQQVPTTTTPVSGDQFTDNAFRAGGQHISVINSPSDLYEHFLQRLNYEDSEEEDRRCNGHLSSLGKQHSSDTSDSDDSSSDNSGGESNLFTPTKEESITRETLPTGIMQAELLQQMQEQMAHLQQELRTQQQKNREFRQRTINVMEQAPIPDSTGSQRPASFHGFDSEDINRWLDKVENYLKLRRINTDSPTALAELVLNLAGPAEDFYYSLAEDKKDTFVHLRDALRERFANENQSWIVWQAITTRQQGPVESLDTYLNDLTNKFRRIKISDADKMRYFVQGLRADLRETVLLKQPKSFQEAEEMARLTAAVKTTMNNSIATMTAQLNQLTQTLNTMVAGTKSSVNNQQQAMQAQMDTLTKKLDSLLSPPTNQDKVAAYPEPGKEEQIMKLIRELTNEMRSLDRRVDARLNGMAQWRHGNDQEMDDLFVFLVA